MNYRKLFNYIFIVIIIFVLVGCSQKNQDDSEVGKIEQKVDGEVNINNEENTVIIDKIDSNPKEDKVKEGWIMSPLSGEYAPKEKVERRPVVVVFDNHPRARWQAGLSEAEIVYEYLVEGNITRYLGIFLINDPEIIGPIRSARPYFITSLLEYDGVFVRCGGSPQAYEDARKLKIADIDGITSSPKVFWRNSKIGKRAPHNLYSGMDIIRKTQVERGYRLTGKYEGFKFNEEDNDIDGITAENVLINYSNDNNTKFVYDSEIKKYKRYKDGKLHVDESNKKALTAKNIIIQRANTKVIDNEGRLSIDLIGEGKGIYITNGKSIEISWKKENRSSKTYFYDNKNNEIKLNPGTTWIQVVRNNTDIIIK